MKPDGGRPKMMSPDMLLARTHGCNFGNAGASGRRPKSSASIWSSPSAAESSQGPRPAAAHKVDSVPANRRFYMTAPAARIEVSDVQDATGVRLSQDQLQALRKRYQGGHARSGEAHSAFGGGPTTDDLRQEVFGSLVLRPGQWPKLGSSAASECDAPARQGTAQRLSGGSTSLPAAAAPRRGVPGGRQAIPGRG